EPESTRPPSGGYRESALPPPGILVRSVFSCRPYDAAMLRWLRHRLAAWRSRSSVESSRLIVGSTGSGKSEGELVDLARLADRRDHAIVLLDGHGPLAFAAAGHWAHRGHEERMLVEPLAATARTLCWQMLPKSAAPTASQRSIEDAETTDEIAQCFMAQR